MAVCKEKKQKGWEDYKERGERGEREEEEEKKKGLWRGTYIVSLDKEARKNHTSCGRTMSEYPVSRKKKNNE